jgi:hypothetical protein
MKELIITICIFLMIISLAVAGFCFLELRASNTLLRKIAFLQPGMNLDKVKNELGQEMDEMHDIDVMVMRGSVKNRALSE